MDVINIDKKLEFIKYLKAMVIFMNDALINNFKQPSIDCILSEIDVIEKFISDFNNMKWGE